MKIGMRPCSAITKNKIGIANKGKKNGFFKHGMTNSVFHKKWIKNKYKNKINGRVFWNNFNDFKNEMYKTFLLHIKKYGEKNTVLAFINGKYKWITVDEQIKIHICRIKSTIVNDKTREKMSISNLKNGKKPPVFRGNNHPGWRGEKAGYRSKHIWMETNHGKPTTCELCKKNNLTGHSIHWANISGKYKRSRDDWKRLCVKCHFKFDKIKICQKLEF